MTDGLSIAASRYCIAGIELIQAQLRIARGGGVHYTGPQWRRIGGRNGRIIWTTVILKICVTARPSGGGYIAIDGGNRTTVRMGLRLLLVGVVCGRGIDRRARYDSGVAEFECGGSVH